MNEAHANDRYKSCRETIDTKSSYVRSWKDILTEMLANLAGSI